MNAVRYPALVVLIALVVGATLFATSATPVGNATLLPPLHSALSTTPDSGDLWFCVGPTVDMDGINERIVTLTSISDEATLGRVSVIGNKGADVERAFQLEPGRSIEIRPGLFVPGALFAGITVEVPGGRVLVEQRITGGRNDDEATPGIGTGVDESPCGTITSASWQVPWATTAEPGNRAVLLAYNPFRAPAVADLRFIGDLGRRETLDTRGVVVAGRSLAVFDLNELIPNSSVVSASVDTRVGQLVVARLQVTSLPTTESGTTVGSTGLAVTPGLPETSDRLFLPGVSRERDITSSVVVMNPGEDATELEVLVRPESVGTFVEPWRLTLRGRQRQVVDLDSGRIADIGRFAIEVRSLDAVPLAASLISRPVEGASSAGLSVLPAVGAAATDWMVHLTGPADQALLVVSNPGETTIATVRLSLLGAAWPSDIPDLYEIDPAGHVDVELGTAISAEATVLVDSTVPVLAVMRRNNPSGRSSSFGMAIAGTQSRPSP
ncbi:MAG TPA: hypothetical protein DF783_06270 [Acidimicrobiaceae bacterium]|jgi:hypothetical protein|nr:hypothetical protein [Acidimicrobiaceae bacterium]HJO79500.1 DUF5719 family protein [Acidimicrobiales bacterium]|tara:strand:+ start:3742 stop:5229 length:1488 start_codon:yes stop_codon:yes gene_type:complete